MDWKKHKKNLIISGIIILGIIVFFVYASYWNKKLLTNTCTLQCEYSNKCGLVYEGSEYKWCYKPYGIGTNIFPSQKECINHCYTLDSSW